jgi:hypothetical protein
MKKGAPLALSPDGMLNVRSVKAGPTEHCAGALAYLEQLDQHTSHPPIEDLSLLADAVGRFLESGDRKLIGDPDELREAFDRIEAYRQFQPDHFDRGRVNRQLRALVE